VILEIKFTVLIRQHETGMQRQQPSKSDAQYYCGSTSQKVAYERCTCLKSLSGCPPIPASECPVRISDDLDQSMFEPNNFMLQAFNFLLQRCDRISMNLIAHCEVLFWKKLREATKPIVRPNVGANRPAEAGGVSLARDSGEAAARQAYTACRSGSG